VPFINRPAPQADAKIVASSLAAIAFSSVLVPLGLYQAALAAGAPLGHFAWGGRSRVLPPLLRIGSLTSLLLYALMSVVFLSKQPSFTSCRMT
jgi:hypothetical protein